MCSAFWWQPIYSVEVWTLSVWTSYSTTICPKTLIPTCIVWLVLDVSAPKGWPSPLFRMSEYFCTRNVHFSKRFIKTGRNFGHAIKNANWKLFYIWIGVMPRSSMKSKTVSMSTSRNYRMKLISHRTVSHTTQNKWHLHIQIASMPC